MTLSLRMATVIGTMLAITCWGQAAFAQKSGGTLRISFFDNPASMSLHEEATGAALRPMMGVFNNLVMYDQHVAQNSLQIDRPRSGDGLVLERGRQGADLPAAPAASNGTTASRSPPPTSNAPGICCSASAAKSSASIRARPGISTSTEVTTNGDYEVTFHLKRPQPALLALLASGLVAGLPCHVSPREMRQHPIGTGPFKFVEFKPNEVIRMARNPDYWKPGRPYLDGIEWHDHPDIATRNPGVHRRQVRHVLALWHDGSVC